MGFNSGFKGLIPYRQWKHTEVAPLICYAQQTVVFLHTFRKLILFILTVCCIDMVSEWLEYCIHLRSISQGIPHQTYASTAPTSRHQMILIQFELFLSIYNLLFTQILMYTPWGWPTKGRHMSELQCIKCKNFKIQHSTFVDTFSNFNIIHLDLRISFNIINSKFAFFKTI